MVVQGSTQNGSFQSHQMFRKSRTSIGRLLGVPATHVFKVRHRTVRYERTAVRPDGLSLRSSACVVSSNVM